MSESDARAPDQGEAAPPLDASLRVDTRALSSEEQDFARMMGFGDETDAAPPAPAARKPASKVLARPPVAMLSTPAPPAEPRPESTDDVFVNPWNAATVQTDSARVSESTPETPPLDGIAVPAANSRRLDRPAEIAFARVEPRGTLGIIVNPHSGRDARRLFARAGTSTVDDKRNQVTRIVVGAAAAGCERVLLSRDSFRIASAATDALDLPIEIELLDLATTGHARDSERAALAMRDAGCSAIVALGGDGTSRTIVRAWRDVVLLPLSTGTNNVFPHPIEATIAGAAAGLVAAGRLAREHAAERAKIALIRCDDGRESLALIDAGLLLDDHPGSLLQVDPGKLARILLTRAEPASVGLSPIGGLLMPCSAEDDFGVCVELRTGPGREDAGKVLRAPISPGLYENVAIEAVRRVSLGAEVVWHGPGLLTFDGDREIVLGKGAAATLRVVREGPWVIDPRRALRAAAEGGLFLDLGHWHDHRGAAGGSCC